MALCVVFAAACGATASPAQELVSRSALQTDVGLHDAIELAQLLPPDAERCSVIRPAQVPAKSRALVLLLSQAEQVPWGLDLPVTAYARAELQPGADRRRVVELLRVRGSDPQTIRDQLTERAGRPITWGGDGPVCRGALPCFTVRARFIDNQTVRIASGAWPYDAGAGESPCAKLLRAHPDAAEVTERVAMRALSSVSTARSTQLLLFTTEQGVERLERKVFPDDGGARRAARLAASGTLDLPNMAGLPVMETATTHGAMLERRSRLSWDDLRLALADRGRMRRAMSYDEAVRGAGSGELALSDLKAVHATVDLRLRALSGIGGAEREAAAESLRVLLERARREHPRDARLARKLYGLLLRELRRPAAAREVADSVLASHPDDEEGWKLLRRAALARADREQLALALRRAHKLSPFQAKRMAEELARRVSEGEDYERAEWAFLSSLDLDRLAAQEPLQAVRGVSLDLVSLPRVVGHLAALTSFESAPLGLHLQVRGALRIDGLEAPSEHEQLWLRATGDTPTLVGAVPIADDAKLAALGKALQDRLAEGPLELVVQVRALGRGSSQQHTALLRLSGRLSEGRIQVNAASRAARKIRWARVTRYLAAPLGNMKGRVFPPEELVVLAESESVARALTRAGNEQGVRCFAEGIEVRCRGAFHDSTLAHRALRAIGRIALRQEVQMLWSVERETTPY